ncbi:hypothetical protein K438DRAFT_1963282 [Mycena galopus ATCC 62051]|nr:hypothetical protein K438DRAFT_1963282 [Mycena galopus ATCC 62051]
MRTPNPPGSKKSSRAQDYQVLISTVRDFGTEANATDLEESLLNLTNRRSFKNMKDGVKPVWSKQLEGALLQGLERTRHLRKVYRNRFISEFIFQETNEFRTAKQVGSRLQQLQQTTKNHGVRQLIKRLPISEEQDLLALTSSHPRRQKDEVSNVNTRLFIAITSQIADSCSPPPGINLLSPPKFIRLRRQPPFSELGHRVDSTVVLLSPVALALYSTFELFGDNRSCFISASHLLPDGIRNGQLRSYVTSFPDDLWLELSNRLPYDQCTEWAILQQVFRQENDISSGITRNYTFTEIRYSFERSWWRIEHDQRLISKDPLCHTTRLRVAPPTAAQSLPYLRPLLKSEAEFYSMAGTYDPDVVYPVEASSNEEFVQTEWFHPPCILPEDTATNMSSPTEYMPLFQSSLGLPWLAEGKTLYSALEANRNQSDFGALRYSNNVYFNNYPVGNFDMFNNGVEASTVHHATYPITRELTVYDYWFA